MSAEQLELPDPEEGARRRDEAIERVTENATERWRQIAWKAALVAIQEIGIGGLFTSERIREILVRWKEWPPPNDPRAMAGPVVRLRKEGYVSMTPEKTKSVYASSNRMTKNVWRVVRLP